MPRPGSVTGATRHDDELMWHSIEIFKADTPSFDFFENDSFYMHCPYSLFLYIFENKYKDRQTYIDMYTYTYVFYKKEDA